MKRVFIIVLDSLGIGKMPDAQLFSDKNCNTLKRISESPKFSSKNCEKLGLGNIEGVDYISASPSPLCAVGRMAEKSNGKDTTIGHWEIAGVVSENPLPTYPNGFPEEIIAEFESATGKKVICNKPYSGTQVIKDYGEEHLKTGNLIVYTSADSVFQIAANEEIVPINTLYDYCKIARKILQGKHSVGRVIARPFTGDCAENFKRTANRHDFSLEPPKQTILDALKDQGKTVYAIGKISDIFAHRGITDKVFTHSNKEGMDKAMKAIEMEFNSLCFVNLVDFDMLYGHRQDIDGYAQGFAEFDQWILGFCDKMRDDDILFITADHGCDPGDESTDHTREYTPLLIYGSKIKPVNLGTRNTFADIGATVAEYLEIEFNGDGNAIKECFYD